jgi:hypothetical protein
MELAGGLVTSPSTIFPTLKHEPRIWFPLLAVCLAIAAVLLWYYSIVDIEWLQDRILSGNSRTAEMTEQQRVQAIKFMSAKLLMGSSLIGGVITILVMRALEATYFTLAGNIVNVRHSFQQWLALSCWTSLPHLVATAVMALYLLTASTNQLGYEELSLLSFNELFFHKSMDEPGFTLLSSLTVMHPWSWWLTVLGVRIWSGRSWLFASVFALAPIVLIYGVWALWTLR